jgi:subtilisin-like proprotein convertase family protein
LLLFWCLAASAASITDSATFNPNVTIPDNDLNGVSDTQTFSSGIQSITDVKISFDISGGYNGDYYAFLRHGDTGFAVLLNRVGRTGANSLGSLDGGFSITLSETAAGDVHGASAGGGTLLGIWQADGRNIDPLSALDTSPRNALLDVFNGMNANGDWTLFIADTSAVGIGTLQDWTLTVSGLAVPEPGAASLLALGGATAWLSLMRKRKKHCGSPKNPRSSST